MRVGLWDGDSLPIRPFLKKKKKKPENCLMRRIGHSIAAGLWCVVYLGGPAVAISASISARLLGLEPGLQSDPFLTSTLANPLAWRTGHSAAMTGLAARSPGCRCDPAQPAD